MANFTAIQDAAIAAILSFVQPAENTLQQFVCKEGEIAGFQIRVLTILGLPFQISQVYDCSSGAPVLLGTVSVVAGTDLTAGLFSSGCFSNGDPFASDTTFYRVDYT